IPGPGGEGQGSPTGMVANGTDGFNGDLFLFATEDGTIAGWQPGSTDATIEVDNSESGAVYKGLALATTPDGSFIYATNFNAGTVDVFDSQFQPASLPGTFVDPHAPDGFAPFNIALIGHRLFVTYAMQDEDKHDDVKGPGHGFLDIFATDGRFIRRLASGTAVGGRLRALNSPWGLSLPPRGFGLEPDSLLVGNFGSGQIA